MKKTKPNSRFVRPLRNERPNNRPYLQSFRTRLRGNLTPAEATLWNYLKRSRLDGRKFRRQHSIGDYILDFYCPSERLAIELDGEVHRSDVARIRDDERKQFLNSYGILVIRFENRIVFEDPEFVVANIRHWFGWWTKA